MAMVSCCILQLLFFFCTFINFILARLRWDAPQNQKNTSHQGKGFNNTFKPPPRIEVWQNQQQNVPERRFINRPQYVGPPSGVPEMQVVQHYAPSHMTQMVRTYLYYNKSSLLYS